jgi:hypothetical protein
MSQNPRRSLSDPKLLNCRNRLGLGQLIGIRKTSTFLQLISHQNTVLFTIVSVQELVNFILTL